MSELPSPDDRTIEHADGTQEDGARQRFVAAWEEALLTGTAGPEVDDYLATFPDAERARLRPELEAVMEPYRRRRGRAPEPEETLPIEPPADGGTVDFAPPRSRPDDPPTAILRNTAAPTRTTEPQPAEPGGTLDYRPAEPRPAEPGATVDHAAAHPAGTVTHETGVESNTAASGRTQGPRGRGPAPQETVAGYEILGTLGRGAMGVVYKARQRGLKRVVALKMILAGGHAGEHELARFRVEAEAVAQLQHPNIVQIYEVGDEDGRPFFSLEYVDGGGLSKKIAGTPQPPAEAAALVRQLAQGMECAHQNGVIHRDLKPANILLTRAGVSKISDFGLAKRLEDEAGQTHSGTILGTPSYMAPEQAEGKVHLVGPLADVYALGAILYEMLTGRAPFKAASVLDTLHQVRTQEPVAPTQLQPKVPRDLETICLKCLQKDPAKRYESAGLLAEDLRRFLAGEPIKARPVTRAERLWRWCRRHPAIAALLSAGALLLAAWGLTATLLLMQLQREKDETDRQRQVAEQNEIRATRNAAIARQNEQKAEKNAQAAREGGEEALRRMLALGGRVQERLHSRRLVRQAAPEIRALRDDLLQVLRQNMLGLTEKIDKAEITPFGRLAAYVALGDLLQKLGQGEEALVQFRQGYALDQQIVAGERDSDKARGNLAVILQRLGEVALDLNGDARAAEAYFRKVHRLQQDVLEHPHDPHANRLEFKIQLARTDIFLARANLALGRPAAAHDALKEALAYRQEWVKIDGRKSPVPHSYLTEVYLWLGTTDWHLGDAQAADEHFGSAVQICESLIKRFPHDFSFGSDLADICGAYGDAQLRLGKIKEARHNYERSAGMLRQVLAASPDDPGLLPLQALTNERLGALALAERKGPAADQYFQEGLKLREDMVRVAPGNLTWRAAYLLALAHRGRPEEAVRGANDLCRRAPTSTPLLLQAARCYALAAAAEIGQRQHYLSRALDVLQAATASGYRDRVALQTDPDLASLRQEPAWQTLLASLPTDGG